MGDYRSQRTDWPDTPRDVMADEIDRLAAENDRLRERLSPSMEYGPNGEVVGYGEDEIDRLRRERDEFQRKRDGLVEIIDEKDRQYLAQFGKLLEAEAKAAELEARVTQLSDLAEIRRKAYAEVAKQMQRAEAAEAHESTTEEARAESDKNTSTAEDALGELAKQAQDLDMGY